MRYWSVLFGLAAILSVLAFVYAPFSPDWWVPEAGSPPHVISTFGREIDSLFLIILWITGIVYIGTQIVLVWCSTNSPMSSTHRVSRCGRHNISTAASGSR